MRSSSRGCLLVVGLVATVASLSPTGARAQTPAPNEPTPESSTPIDPRQDPRSTGSTRSGESLSDRLGRSESVIRPPTTLNPDMAVRPPVPDPGTTPVIPPPGSPGGNPDVAPK
jgi:hypothetical protein